MISQKTPPPGWPHTEAEKHRESLHAAPQPGVVPAPRPPRRSSRRTGCCLGLFMFLLAVAGVVVFVVWTAATDTGASDLEEASSAFRAANPTWLVESADRPDEGSDSVRLVAWNDPHYIGRLVYMVRDETVPEGWSEFPLIDTLENDRAAEDAFISAFSETFGHVYWTYVRDVEPVDVGANPEVWTASYRILDQSSEEWSEVRAAYVERDPSTGAWTVYPESSPQ